MRDLRCGGACRCWRLRGLRDRRCAPMPADRPRPRPTRRRRPRRRRTDAARGATATQVGRRSRVRVEAAGLAPGAYGAHIHAVGRCDAPGFDSAGPHWNPTGRQHGKRQSRRAMHTATCPISLVGTDGRGSFEFTIAGAGLAAAPQPLLDADGAAMVIHASAGRLSHRPDAAIAAPGSPAACSLGSARSARRRRAARSTLRRFELGDAARCRATGRAG